MPQSVSGSSEVLVNGKVPRPNKKNNLRDTTELVAIKLRPGYSAHPNKVAGAITYERYCEIERIKAERKAKKLAKR